MKLKNAAIVSRDETNERFQLSYSRGYHGRTLEQTLENGHPLIQYLTRVKEPLVLERLTNPQKKDELSGLSDADQYKIAGWMQSVEGACCVPSFLGKELKNILVLGEKKSRHAYSQ